MGEHNSIFEAVMKIKEFILHNPIKNTKFYKKFILYNVTRYNTTGNLYFY